MAVKSKKPKAQSAALSKAGEISLNTTLNKSQQLELHRWMALNRE